MKNIGNKAKNLIWLKENNIPVPDFLIINPEKIIINYKELKNKIIENIRTENLNLSKFLEEIKWEEKSIEDCLKFNEEEVAFRTSASIEDGKNYSFAGLYETFLKVKLDKDNFKKYISLCIKSLFSQRVISYLKDNNIDIKDIDCSIIIQKMFNPTYSGIAFVYENNNHSQVVYNKGFCKNIVNGGDAFSFNLNKIPNDFKKIKNSESLLLCLKNIYNLKKTPQDIEWGISEKSFCILQTRDITKDPFLNKENIEIYDCTNISESYPGITLPLTYSFINYLYSKVYVSFLSLLGIKNTYKYKDIFDNMLGYIDGRVYYKIENWYNFLKILPGYKYNKDFFEKMLVPKKNIGTKKENKFKASFLINIPILIKLFLKLLIYKKDNQNFINRFNNKYKKHKEKDLSQMTNKDIFTYYEKLRDDFLNDWKIPIMNDFRLMVFHGLLYKYLSKKGLNQKNINEVMSGFAKEQYFEIIREISKLSLMIEKENKLKDMFAQKNNKKIYNDLIKSDDVIFNDFKKSLDYYLNNFYYRRPGELKLESENIIDNPETIINLIKNYPKQIEVKKEQIKLSGFFIKIIADKTKDSIKNREIFRAKRALVFGIAKDCFMQIAFNFENSGIIEDKKDIFFLNTDEIKNIINRNTLEKNYKELINKRKMDIQEYKKTILPDRFKIYEYGEKRIILDDTIEIYDNLKGLPVSSGIVRGRVLVLEEFKASADFKDKILVTYQTDPGWSIVFPLLKGVILERGNALSHASILSREMGIPSIVKVKNAVSLIKNNQLIELNGNNGEIKIIKE